MKYLIIIICLLNVIIRVHLQQFNSNSTIDHSSQSKCFHQENIDCSDIMNSNNCPCKKIKFLSDEIEQRDSIYCCNLNSDILYTSLDCANFSSSIYDLHIKNATIDVLDISGVKWKNLKSLSITDGRINRVEGQFLNDTKISCLNLSNNALTDIENNFMTQLNYLKHLDLSYNNITHLPALNEKLHTLDISGINTISCTEIANTIDTNKNYSRWLSFIHRNKSVCSAYSNYVWFNETEQLSLEELRNIKNLLSKCPRGENWHCKCNFNRMVSFANNVSVRTVDVDCSSNNLTELPKELPPYTVTLTVTNNRIDKLDEIITNPSYHYLQHLYADYNEISSINILEGSKFANTFYSLSLRFNKLKSIPTYILVPKQYNDSDEVNSFIKLGGNEVFCDCYAARYLKDWLLLNVIDDDQVYCKNCLDRVVDLDVKQMCKFNNDLTDYIYCIITIEVILLVTVLTKFFSIIGTTKKKVNFLGFQE